MKADIKVISTGHYLPEYKLTNEMLSNQVETSDAWIQERTGIKTRRIVKEETALDLAYKACLNMIETSNLNLDSIKLIIVASMSHLEIMPNIASMLQAKLNLNTQKVMAFDINVACSGFVYGLVLANSLLKEGERALVVGTETLSRLVDYSDRSTCILFGDGAGCALVEGTTSPTGLIYYAGSIGDDKGKLIVNKTTRFMEMEGREVFKFATQILPEVATQLITATQISLNDISLIIPHQANQRILDYVTRKLKISKELMFSNVEHYGNTSAASIAIALSEVYEQNILKPNDKYMLIGFGGGLSYGGLLLTK